MFDHTRSCVVLTALIGAWLCAPLSVMTSRTTKRIVHGWEMVVNVA